ncbi:TonB-dependent receptor plug domain-containing protein [Pseudoduganella sp. FT25W]|jgi:outer membrane receptor protein involved in Fe transport|uniref:TonB-dependent receptor plug domain-containing protein n=1 Tax=Duganella alba TaxID=2666081 RepID=A0A6L5QQ02_9BURK|nr:TonB-dependent receptor [Duganella alba]MRX11755.1 TonB-dependent receptor plug domain-containing protein [Duganella alba]MRX20135.1 TonB-dependent receptor plug domain-containing protein [Duganella alba]
MKRRAIVASVMLAWTGAAVAAETSAPAYPAASMLSVDVVGIAPLPGLGVERNQLPYQVQTARADTIDLAAGQNLGEFMARNLTGVNVNEISGSPFQNDITYRGFRASPVLGSSQGISVYLDGVRVNEPFGDVVNWDMLPEAAIGSVMLAPGSNPLYGLNTLGGALVLASKSGKSHPGLDANISTASNGQRRADLAYGYDSGEHWNAFIAGTAFRDNGWRDQSDGNLGNLYAKLAGAVGDNDWSVAVLAGRSRLTGNGLLPDDLYEQNRRAVYTSPDVTRNRLRQIVFSMTHRFDDHTEMTAALYARNSHRSTVNGDINDDYAEGESDHAATYNTTETRQNSQGFSTQFSKTSGAHQFSAGLTFDRSSVSFAQFEQEADFAANRSVLMDDDEEREAGSSVDGSSRAAGLYAADTWNVADGAWLTVSARFNHARVSNQLRRDDDDVQARETFSYRKLNPALGLAQLMGGGWTLFANLSQSNRVPTVIELGCADPEQPCRLPVGLQSDPYLKQVVSRTGEAGARWQGARGDMAAVSVYRTVNRDDILFRSASLAQQGYFSNFARTRHQGVDLSASRRYGAWNARLSYSYLDATYDAEGDLFTGVRNVHVTPGTRLAGLPRNTLKLGLDWNPVAALTLGADIVALSDMITQGNEDGQAAPAGADWRIRGHALLGLHASYQPAPKWELYARVTNATNRRYESFGAVAVNMFPNGALWQPGADDPAQARFVAPGAPRAVAAGLRYRF